MELPLDAGAEAPSGTCHSGALTLTPGAPGGRRSERRPLCGAGVSRGPQRPPSVLAAGSTPNTRPPHSKLPVGPRLRSAGVKTPDSGQPPLPVCVQDSHPLSPSRPVLLASAGRVLVAVGTSL